MARRGRGAGERTPNAVVAPGRIIVNREITARHSPHAPSIPPEQAGQESMLPIETRTGRLSRTRTKTRTMAKARGIGGSLPAGWS
jgi:hypothetical protein